MDQRTKPVGAVSFDLFWTRVKSLGKGKGPERDMAPGPCLVLCENVFELSAMAEELQIIGSITVEDSRELFYLVLDWAEEFEKQFDPETQDYLTEIESFGRRKLLGTFQTVPEPEPNISL